MTALLFIPLVFLGSFVAGLLGALTGLGGGVVIVPLLVVAFHVHIKYAIGASLISVIATSSGAAAAYVREGFSNIRIGMFLEIATTMGALFGAFLAARVAGSFIAIVFAGVIRLSRISADGARGSAASVTISVSVMTTRRIPLFPLNVVLLPGMTLPLHIFEQRYKRMMKTVIDDELPFGIVLSRESGIATVGCTALVRRVARNYPDGRMDVVTLGESACHIRAVHKDKEYLEATVDLMADNFQPGSTAAAEELITLFTDCHLLLHGSPPGDIDIDDHLDGLLAYRIASDLPLELDTLQELLEIRAEAERRIKLISRLNQLLPQLVQIQQMRSKSVANSHGPN